MYNLYAFVKWCTVHTVRWIMTGPRRLHNWCTEYIEDNDITDVLMIMVLMGLLCGSALFFLGTLAAFNIFRVYGVHISNLVCGLIIAIPAMFLSTVAIRVLYRKFRREQEEIFNTLKKDYRA